MFGDFVGQNIIKNFYSNNKAGEIITVIAQMSFTILVVFSYPLQCHPCRSSVEKVLDVIYQKKLRKKMDRLRYVIITTVILILSYIIAFFVHDLTTVSLYMHIPFLNMRKVLGFVGATGSTLVCYILPPLLYLKLMRQERLSAQKIAAMILLGVGLVIMTVCTVSTFL